MLTILRTHVINSSRWMFAATLLGPALVSLSTGEAQERRGYRIESVAGTGERTPADEGHQALDTAIADPFGVVIGHDGALYVCEVGHHRVWRIDLGDGSASVFAGTGTRGYSGDGGLATNAEMNEPYEIRFDAVGNAYVVEMMNHVVRRIDRGSGIITTVAGTGIAGFSGDGADATDAQLNRPHSIALDDVGAIYIADIGNHRIRRVDPESGLIQSIAGNGERQLPDDGDQANDRPMIGPRALYIRGNTMWIALREGHSIWTMNLETGTVHHLAGNGASGYGGEIVSIEAAQFNGPKGIAVDEDGKVFVVDTENHAIRLIDSVGTNVITVAGRPHRVGTSSDPDDVDLNHADQNAVSGDIGDGDVATNARLDRPHGVCVDADGNVYIGDTLNHRVRRLTPISETRNSKNTSASDQ